MRKEFEFPKISAVKSVLEKIGVDPSTRYDGFDQDHEYTSCRLQELVQYVELYQREDTDDFEKRVLGCFFMECLNEYFQSEGSSHSVQDKVFEFMHSDIEIHETELEGWANSSDPDKENWWPITEEILKWRDAYQGSAHNSGGCAPSA